MAVFRSGNGWAVLNRDDLTWFTAAGERFAAASEDVATLAAHLIERFNAEVEPVVASRTLDDWSWAVRPVRGSTTTISNHASATAWDLNALQHPRGVHGTFTAAETHRVRAILASIKDATGRLVFRWGNDYVTSPVDSMHFEINTTPGHVAEAAHIIRAKQAAQAQEDDVSFKDVHTLTAADVAAYGDPSLKVGDKKSYDEILRFPPALARLRREQAARDTALTAQISTLTAAVAALTAAKPATKT